ncbi:hypothetical protein [Flaviaesturariibacter aridisoli]|uniref:Uncharacterized protein n=1 Tax=Flaviaesturariibacter aridisoli TaxID=2545761 RepID=A0A4R4DW39_9BACT|nr:hypothetical protein [Flaviaesturariibacter aridisoli]TCZ68290.1 hypothetical protein E0486_14575 [Flaviaesturariibacter aridisoli]
MERGNQQRGSSFGQESMGSRQQESSQDQNFSSGRGQQQEQRQQSSQQDVSGSRDQNPQRGSSWENYQSRELSGGQQRQEGIEGRSEQLNDSNEGNLGQNDMD